MVNRMISEQPQPTSTPLHSTIDRSIMSRMNEADSNVENDMATMDDMAFNASLDALLENEGSVVFVDSTDISTDDVVIQASVNFSPDSSTRFSSVATTNILPPCQQTTQYLQAPAQSIFASNGLQKQRMHQATDQAPVITAQHGPTNSQTQHQFVSIVPGSARPTNDSSVIPSPLTARLNFPLTAVAAAPQFPAVSQTPISLPQGSFKLTEKISVRRTATILPPPQSVRQKRGRTEAPASVIMASVHDFSSTVSEDEGDGKQRRMGRNQREQQRSHRITEQITQLRDVLASANVSFKPDKYSTLVTVAEYITQLQDRSGILDTEHKQLLDTITKTNEMVNNSHYQTNANGDLSLGQNLVADTVPSGPVLEVEVGVFVTGLDYRAVFNHCGMAFAIASIDGRFIDCNSDFERLTGYTRDELLPGVSKKQIPVADSVTSSSESVGSDCGSSMSGDDSPRRKGNEPIRNLSLFNLLSRTAMEQVFTAMSHMLKQPVSSTQVEPSLALQLSDFWSGLVTQSRRQDVKVRPIRDHVERPAILVFFLAHIPILAPNECHFSTKPTRSAQVLQLRSRAGSQGLLAPGTS